MIGKNMEYVYRYVDCNGETVYVGITRNMQRRVRQHQTDKLKDIENPTIYCFPVKYRGDAEMLETYLINWYGTGKHYNVAKTQKGDFSFLDVCNDLPWRQYGLCDLSMEKPFVISDIIATKKVVVKKKVRVREKVYVKENPVVSGNDYQVQKLMIDFKKGLKKSLEYEEFMCVRLMELQNECTDCSPIMLKKGAYLHDKRRRCLVLIDKLSDYYFYRQSVFVIIPKRIFELRRTRFLKACELNTKTMCDIELFEGSEYQREYGKKHYSDLGKDDADGRGSCAV